MFSLTCIPSDLKSYLDDKGVNYMEVEEFELFMSLSTNLKVEETKLLFGSLDFTKFEVVKDEQLNQLVMYDFENDIKIDYYVYNKIVKYLRTIHNIEPKIEKAYNEKTRQVLIQLDREKIEKEKNKPYQSKLKYLIGSLLRFSGCSLGLEEIKKLNIYALTQMVSGARVYLSSVALLQGMYSGQIDVKKIDKEDIDWTRNL